MGGLCGQTKKKEQKQDSGQSDNQQLEKTKKEVTEADKTVLELKVVQNKLQTYQKTLQQRMKDAKEKARMHLKNKQKDRAKMALQIFKISEKYYQQAQGEELTIEQSIQQVQSAQITSQVAQALKHGNDVLKDINSKMSLSQVEKIMADTSEAIEMQNQVSQVLQDEGVTDQQLLAELDQLEELEAIEIKEKLEGANVPQQSLSKPQEIAVKKQKQEVVIVT